MPKVGKKKFAYTKEGKELAEKYSKASGERVKKEKPMKKKYSS